MPARSASSISSRIRIARHPELHNSLPSSSEVSCSVLPRLRRLCRSRRCGRPGVWISPRSQLSAGRSRREFVGSISVRAAGAAGVPPCPSGSTFGDAPPTGQPGGGGPFLRKCRSTLCRTVAFIMPGSDGPAARKRPTGTSCRRSARHPRARRRKQRQRHLVDQDSTWFGR